MGGSGKVVDSVSAVPRDGLSRLWGALFCFGVFFRKKVLFGFRGVSQEVAEQPSNGGLLIFEGVSQDLDGIGHGFHELVVRARIRALKA